MSLEVMLYASLAGISLLAAVAYAAAMSNRNAGQLNSYMARIMVDKINIFLLEGGTGSMQAYIPEGMCNATFDDNTGIISSALGNYKIYGNVNMPNGIFCPDGTYASFYAVYKEGKMLIERDYNASAGKH